MAELKKIITTFIIILIILLSSAGICYAGDIPEALLSYDNAQLYFGKLMEVADTSITILPVKKVKGDVELNTPVTYSQGLHGGKAQVGKTYLFGYIDENNLYYWVTDSMDPKTLKIKNASGMDRRLQDYLNNGDFEKAEEARQKRIAVTAAPSISPTVAPTPSPANNTPQSHANTDSSLPIAQEHWKNPPLVFCSSLFYR